MISLPLRLLRLAAPPPAPARALADGAGSLFCRPVPRRAAAIFTNTQPFPVAKPILPSLLPFRMGKTRKTDLSEDLQFQHAHQAGAPPSKRIQLTRPGSSQAKAGHPFPLAKEGAPGAGARGVAHALSDRDQPGEGDQWLGEAGDGDGGGGGDGGVPPPPPRPEVVSKHALRIQRQIAVYAKQRDEGSASYAIRREELDELGRRLLEADVSHRQFKLNVSFRDHPAVSAVYSSIAQVADSDERARLLQLADAELHASGRLRDVCFRTVKYVSMRGAAPLVIPSFSIDGVRFSPPAWTCMSMSTSPLGPVKGTLYFDWALLDQVSFFFLKGGVAMSGELIS